MAGLVTGKADIEVMNWDSIKTLIVGLAVNLLAYFRPIGDEVFLLAMVFLINFMTGLVADIVINGNSFEFRKAWRCINEVTVFFGMALFIFMFGEKKGWPGGATQCVSFLTYVITWFYSQNVLRNLRILFRRGTVAYKVTDFLYYVLSVEFIKKIPFLQEWKETNKDNKSKTHKQHGDKQERHRADQEI